MVSDLQREQRRKAGQRPRKPRGSGDAPPQTGGNPSAPIDLGKLSAELRSRMDAYRELIGPPATWSDVRTFEQVIEQMIVNERKQIELSQTRGELFNKAQIQERDERCDEVIFTHLDAFVAFVGTLVPPQNKTDVCARTREWLDQTKGDIDSGLRSLR